MTKQEFPSNSDALAFSKRERLDTKGAVPDSADVAFSKKAQLDKKGAPPDADLPFSKTKQMGKATGRKTRRAR